MAQAWTVDEYDTNNDGKVDLHVRHRDTNGDGRDDEWHWDRDKDNVFDPKEPHHTGVKKVTPIEWPYKSWQGFKVEWDNKVKWYGFKDKNGDGDTADKGEMLQSYTYRGGFIVKVDKFEMVAPWIGLASITTIATIGAVIYIRRRKVK
jgi:hypothetical protein